VEVGPQEVVDGESDVEVRNIEEITSDVVNPVVHPDLATGGAETRLAGKWYAMLIPAARADVEGITTVRVAAEYHAFDGLAEVGALVGRDLDFEA
jgi:hypothetical protein